MQPCQRRPPNHPKRFGRCRSEPEQLFPRKRGAHIASKSNLFLTSSIYLSRHLRWQMTSYWRHQRRPAAGCTKAQLKFLPTYRIYGQGWRLHRPNRTGRSVWRQRENSGSEIPPSFSSSWMLDAVILPQSQLLALRFGFFKHSPFPYFVCLMEGWRKYECTYHKKRWWNISISITPSSAAAQVWSLNKRKISKWD